MRMMGKCMVLQIVSPLNDQGLQVLCWSVVFTRTIFPCDTLGVNYRCTKFEMKSPLCTADYVVKPQCVGYSNKCFKHPTRSLPFSCKFFAQLC